MNLKYEHPSRRSIIFKSCAPVNMSKPSPFFHHPATAPTDSLALLHLKRDSLLPITLRSTADDGYAEGAVTNTRFGSFPHKTLIGREWGSQIRASRVDTGSRGRKGKAWKGDGEAKAVESVQANASDSPVTDSTGTAVVDSADVSKKRKSIVLEAGLDEDTAVTSPKKVKANPVTQNASNSKPTSSANSGFIHLLPPTPEGWTASLDHRTQVVYTPDYSYILARLNVRPGGTLIEAGAGSGSFTHAAARAVFNGYSSDTCPAKLGAVYSYEYHLPRAEALRIELADHGLEGVVHLTHRDVCGDGFSLPSTPPNADAIFLDLPAPWQALKHLSRTTPNSPLNPDAAIHLCTFSPCIEQVTATVSFLRRNGWTEIEMVEVANKRIDVRREQVGLHNEGLRGVNASAATVDEALDRLREVDNKLKEFHSQHLPKGEGGDRVEDAGRPHIRSKLERLEGNKREAAERKVYKEGNLVHRTEPEVKTHTSYLVFAALPRAWSEEDEARCLLEWPVEEAMKMKVEARGAEKGKRGKKGKVVTLET